MLTQPYKPPWKGSMQRWWVTDWAGHVLGSVACSGMGKWHINHIQVHYHPSLHLV
jgi:hypothetical protein